MKFSSLEILIGQYHRVRVGLESARPNMPDSERLSMDIQVSAPSKSRDIGLDQRAFVADVGNYLEKKIYWCDREIILGRIAPRKEEKLSWSKIIKIIKIKSANRIDKYYYKDPSSMSKRFRNVIYPQAESYFRAVGYLR